MTTKALFVTAMGGAGSAMGITNQAFTADNTTNQLTDASHGRETADGPFRLAHGAGLFDQLPTGLAPFKGIGTLTGTTIANTNTVTIDGKVYTFQDTLTDVDGNVHVGATDSDSLDNLIDAINLGPGAGTDYATSMTLHSTVGAAAGAGDTMDVIAKVAGLAGNVATISTLGAGDFAAATLLGGLDVAEYWIIKVDDNIYQLSLTENGAAVAFTDDGNGTHALAASAQGLADQLEDALLDVLTSPGNRSNIPAVNIAKFWASAITGV